MPRWRRAVRRSLSHISDRLLWVRVSLSVAGQWVGSPPSITPSTGCGPEPRTGDRRRAARDPGYGRTPPTNRSPRRSRSTARTARYSTRRRVVSTSQGPGGLRRGGGPATLHWSERLVCGLRYARVIARPTGVTRATYRRCNESTGGGGRERDGRRPALRRGAPPRSRRPTRAAHGARGRAAARVQPGAALDRAGRRAGGAVDDAVHRRVGGTAADRPAHRRRGRRRRPDRAGRPHGRRG